MIIFILSLICGIAGLFLIIKFFRSSDLLIVLGTTLLSSFLVSVIFLSCNKHTGHYLNRKEEYVLNIEEISKSNLNDDENLIKYANAYKIIKEYNEEIQWHVEHKNNFWLYFYCNKDIIDNPEKFLINLEKYKVQIN